MIAQPMCTDFYICNSSQQIYVSTTGYMPRSLRGGGREGNEVE